MLKTALKTTSALALCAGLVTPPALAQDNKQSSAGVVPPCPATAEDATFPCLLDNGRVIKNAKTLNRVLARRGADGADDAAQDDEAEATDEAATTEQPAAEQPAAEQPAAEEPAAEEPAAEEPAAEEPAAEEPAAESPVAPAAEAPEAEPKPSAATQAPETEAKQPKDTKKPKDANQSKDAKKPKDRAKTSAAAAASAAAALEDELLVDPAAGEVTTETLTEEDVRSSDEDFATAPTASSGGAAPDAKAAGDQAAAARNADRDSFQKGLLLGLGALAVGAILYNGAKVISNSGDRVVVEEPDGSLTVLKNDDEILRQPGSEVRTQTYDDGSTRTVVTRPNGVRIVTIRAADGTAIKRVRVMPDGSRYVLFDDTLDTDPVETLPAAAPAPRGIAATDQESLREALIASMNERAGRRYTLNQIRTYPSVRALAPEIEVRAITFPTNSAAIPPAQAERLADLGLAIAQVIAEVPDAVFLVEGHTDAVGSAAYNLALSDRRAESVALALTEYFGVPPENLVTQGYGESDLKVPTEEAERRNRRVVVRNITPLLR